MISVIIPTFNEADVIEQTIHKIKANDTAGLISEIIIADGGSTDETLEISTQVNIIILKCLQKGRSAQMNEGASLAKNNILFFLHADSWPPIGFSSFIADAKNKGFAAGCFRLQFDYDHWFLKLNAWFTRFNINNFRFGDQGLFISKEDFINYGGFLTDHIVMEDQEFIKRFQKKNSFIVLPAAVCTSARKYIENGVFKTQGVFFLIYFMYYLGYSQTNLVKTYKRLLRQKKL